MGTSGKLTVKSTDTSLPVMAMVPLSDLNVAYASSSAGSVSGVNSVCSMVGYGCGVTYGTTGAGSILGIR